MNKLLKEYEKHLHIRGLSQHTVNTYLNKVKNVIKKLPPEKFSKENIGDFLLELKKRNRTAKTVNLYRASIISFCNFLDKDIEFPKKMKEKKVTIDYFDEDYFHNDIIYTAERIFQNYIQKKAILFFMFYTGVRKGEVVKTKRKDINFDKNIVKIQGKGMKERIIPFTENTANVMKAYFLTNVQINSAFNLKQTSSIDCMFRTLSEWIDRHLHPHMTRHSFAIMCRKKGLSIEEIQYLLGHEDIATTQRYARIVDGERVMDNYHKLVG